MCKNSCKVVFLDRDGHDERGGQLSLPKRRFEAD